MPLTRAPMHSSRERREELERVVTIGCENGQWLTRPHTVASILRPTDRPVPAPSCNAGTPEDNQSCGLYSRNRLVCVLFRDAVEFRSGLVDLVVCVRHNLCGRHRPTLSGERLVGRLTEHIAEVIGRGAELRHDRKNSERA